MCCCMRCSSARWWWAESTRVRAGDGVIRDVSLDELFSGGMQLLEGARALRVRGALSVQACEDHTLNIMKARRSWTRDFHGDQFSLGRAWYTHLETDREEEYLDHAAASDALVQRVLPGLQDHLIQLVANMVGAPVVRRPGWCGPGVHIFPAGGVLAQRGGEVHFDAEGLSEEQCNQHAPALSAVLMLQAPTSGGALRLWDATYGDPEAAPANGPFDDVDYRVGDLALFSSHRLHQIQAFGGALDRVSMTAHTVLDEGRWECWF